MSRIGRLPITVPAGVTVTVDSNNLVTVKGPKGTLSQQVNHAITVNQEGNMLHLTRANDSKEIVLCTACIVPWCTTWSSV